MTDPAAQQDLADLETQLAAVLATPTLDNHAARAKRAVWVQRTVGEIERLERSLGFKHLRVVTEPDPVPSDRTGH